jgi:serine/threonine protein kinase
MEDTLDPLLGRLVAGKLEILRLLGAGAMGRVYHAHHVGLDKPVAIKVLLNPGGSTDAQALRFQAEARAASRLDHPNSVQILDFGQDRDGLLYIAMEYLEGVDLQDVLKGHDRLPSARVAFIMSQVFAALGAAHQKGVVHRDMKPGNVMLIEKVGDEGRIQDFVKVCDFGLAKILDGEGDHPPLTRQGAIFGTPAYMSPEQARGAPLDGRSDIYACGVIMFKMLSGRTPFRAESPTGVLMQHLQDPPPPLRPLAMELDPRLELIVKRCLEKDPNDRFQDAREVRDALREILRAQGLDLPSVTGVGSAVSAPVGPASWGPPPVRGSTVTKTESMRPPASVPPEEAATALAMPKPRIGSHVATMAAETMPPPTRQLPPVSAPEAPAPPSNAVAAIPGLIALLALVGLIAFLALRAPAPPAAALSDAAVLLNPAPPPPPPAAVPVSGTADASVEANPAEPTSAIEEDQPPNPPQRRKPRPEPVRPPPTPVAAVPPAPAVLSPAPAPPPPAVIVAPDPPRTPGPLAVVLEGVTVSGGVSKRRSEDGLARGMDGARRCVEAAAPKDGPRRGKIEIGAGVDERGRLRSLSAVGDLAIQACLVDAFGMVKLPVPDTGAGRVTFVLSYRPQGE